MSNLSCFLGGDRARLSLQNGTLTISTKHVCELHANQPPSEDAATKHFRNSYHACLWQEPKHAYYLASSGAPHSQGKQKHLETLPKITDALPQWNRSFHPRIHANSSLVAGHNKWIDLTAGTSTRQVCQTNAQKWDWHHHLVAPLDPSTGRV